MTHPLRRPGVVAAIETAVTAHRGRPWRVAGWTDLAERASHPAALLHGPGLSVFAKLAVGADALRQLGDEVTGLALLGAAADISVPVPIGPGCVALGDDTAVLLYEGLAERVPDRRCRDDWESIGRTLARLHQVRGDDFGLAPAGSPNGWFGPLRQDNRPVGSGRWADFYAERRVRPYLAAAVGAGHVPPDVAARVERLLERLPALVGPEPAPTLLHGDAQHHNFVSTDAGAVVVDAAPYLGHPEVDLALLDYFAPAPPETFAAYAEVAPIDRGFAERRELWRLFGYLAVLAVDGASEFGRAFAGRLLHTLERYGA